MGKYFIATYTNIVKDYCDEEFFENLGKIQGDNKVSIIDNTNREKEEYYKRLTDLSVKYLKDYSLYLIQDIPQEHFPFQVNVTYSLGLLRDKFLESGCEYFLIVESDVKPPVDLLEQLDNTIENLPKKWGILGAIYYEGFHDFELEGINESGYCLTGCTVYKRDVIKKYPFRLDLKTDTEIFPDAWICHDILQDGDFKMYNNHDIKCEHLVTEEGLKQSRPL